MIIYDDDVIIIGDDTYDREDLNKRLRIKFEIKDLGGLQYFRSMEIPRSNQRIFISQRRYTLDKESASWGSKPAGTLLS